MFAKKNLFYETNWPLINSLIKNQFKSASVSFIFWVLSKNFKRTKTFLSLSYAAKTASKSLKGPFLTQTICPFWYLFWCIASVSKCSIPALRNSIRLSEMIGNTSPNLINWLTPLVDLIETYEAPSLGLTNMYPGKRALGLFVWVKVGKNVSWPWLLRLSYAIFSDLGLVERRYQWLVFK